MNHAPLKLDPKVLSLDPNGRSRYARERAAENDGIFTRGFVYGLLGCLIAISVVSGALPALLVRTALFVAYVAASVSNGGPI